MAEFMRAQYQKQADRIVQAARQKSGEQGQGYKKKKRPVSGAGTSQFLFEVGIYIETGRGTCFRKGIVPIPIVKIHRSRLPGKKTISLKEKEYE